MWIRTPLTLLGLILIVAIISGIWPVAEKFEVPSRCFDCEKQAGYRGNPTRCFSCEAELQERGQPEKVFDAQWYVRTPNII